jgi:hypothetical protein
LFIGLVDIVDILQGFYEFLIAGLETLIKFVVNIKMIALTVTVVAVLELGA